MTSTFDINKHYSVDLSLNNDENNIYMLIVNKISHRSYETIIRPADIMNIILDIESIYQIIVKSFDSENDDYTFNMNFSGNSLRLSFGALFDKFFKVNFDICLLEKKISSDDELSHNFNKMEIKLRELEENLAQQQNQIISLENNLSNGMISLLHKSSISMGNQSPQNISYGFMFLIPLNLTELDFCDNNRFQGLTSNNMYQYIDYEKITLLYKLKKLKLYMGGYHFSTALAKSETVEYLIIYYHKSSTAGFHSRPYHDKFTGLEHFPNLKHLCVESSTFSNDSFVHNLKSYKHKITKIEMISCSGHNNSELENYCRNNKIEVLIR